MDRGTLLGTCKKSSHRGVPVFVMTVTSFLENLQSLNSDAMHGRMHTVNYIINAEKAIHMDAEKAVRLWWRKELPWVYTRL